MAKSRESTEATRQSIINAAYDLFSAQGYSATSIRQVAQTAEIAQGGLYNHFANKEELFVAVMVQNQPFARIQPLLKDIPTTHKRDALRYLALTLINEYRSRPNSVRLLMTELIEFEGKHSEAIFEPIAVHMMLLIQQLGSMDGELRDISPATFIRALLGVAFAQYLGDALMAGTPLETSNPEEAVEIFLDGILL
jgi:AcrR family transcriptional regulator